MLSARAASATARSDWDGRFEVLNERHHHDVEPVQGLSSAFEGASVRPMPPPLVYVFSPIATDDRWVLERFVSKVDSLNASPFRHSETKLRAISIPGTTYLGGPAWQIGVEGPDEQAVKAAVGDFRQLYTDNNNASAMKVLKILQRAAFGRDTDASHEMIRHLRGLRRTLEKRRKVDPRGKMLEEDPSGGSTERSPDDIIQTWFNGEYFHDDRERASELSPNGHAAVEMMRLSLQMAMRDYLSYWTSIRNIAAAVLRDPALNDA